MALIKKGGSSPTRTVRSSDGVAGSNLTFDDSDFEIIESPRWQTVALIFGRQGHGKTSVVTRYAPYPIAHIDFDGRSRHAVRKAIESGRDIRYTHVDFPAGASKMETEEAKRLGQLAIDRTLKNFEIAVRESQRGNCRTICIDTGTEYSEIVTMAIRGALGKANDYGRSKDLINREWWHIFNTAREGNAHLVVLARDRQIWADNEPTDRYTFRGPEVLADGVDWAGQIRLKTVQAKGALKTGKAKGGVVNSKEFELEITKAGVNIEELGEVYDKSVWDAMGGPFATACTLQYEGSDPEDWTK